jgi:HSP20 family molecular chaperone IbpA
MSRENTGVAVAIDRNPANGDASTTNHPREASSAPTYTPPIDIHEVADGLVLEADLPGVSQNNLTIELEDNVLSLRAKVDSPVTEAARVLHEEYRPGDFYRSFILSDEVDRSRISAELNNGVLKLTLPKAERARTRRIEIKTS